MKIANLMKSAAMIALAGGMALSLASTADAAKKVRWKMHSAFGKNLAMIGPPPHRIAKQIKEMSEGSFDIKVFEPGALTGGYAYFDPISKGAIDAAWGTPGANQGKNSAYSFLSTWPFGPAAPEFLAWMLHGGGVQIAEKLYGRAGIKYILCNIIPPETSGWFRTKITSLDQLKGLKMRFFGVGARVMQKFGVSTQQLAAADIYPALELGTIDATEFSMPVIDRSLGFYQIAKFNYYPGWHQQSTTGEIIINMKKWKSLKRGHQVMLEVACRAQLSTSIAEGEATQFPAMIKNIKSGVTNVRWSQKILDQLEGAWKEVLAEEIKANPDVKMLWASYTKFHKDYKIWGDMGYLK